MRLRLEIFKEVLVLTVEQEVSPRGVLVLNAGFAKLAQTDVQWIFVDLTRAEVGPVSARMAMETQAQRHLPSIKKVFFVGSVPGLCEFDTMDKALDACAAPEAAVLKEKVRIESEVRVLRARKAEMQAEQSGASAGKRERLALEAENRQLKRIRTSMLKEIDACIKAAQPGSQETASAIVDEMEKVRDEVLKALREGGLE
jgi:hypothetical protein